MCAGILSELLQRENRVLHFWTLKKRRLDQCQQYLMFQSHAQQVDKPRPLSLKTLVLNTQRSLSVTRLYPSHVLFQAMDWLQQSGDHYLATHTSPGASVPETQELLNQHREFCVSAKVRTHTRARKLL